MVEKIAFIGAGAMAEAMVAGIIHTKFLPSQQLFITNKGNDARLAEITLTYGVQCSRDKAHVIKDAEIVVFATKPHDLEEAICHTRDYLTKDQLIISVIAGVSTGYIQSQLGKRAAIIRAMPNTAAQVGYSATAISKGAFATEDHVELAIQFFQAIGTVTVVAEDQMHVVTGISGSGPAYIYYLVEAMEEAAALEGLDVDIAKQLISQTVIGAGKMLREQTASAATLRENVTSPNGTTAAGLETLTDFHFKKAILACVKNAASRSRELGKG